MADDSLLTKCPHCQTLFRIQQEHLAAAGGEVRCGVCYKIFDAENEGLSYSQGEGSPREQTFQSNSEGDSVAAEQPVGQDEIIDTSPEPEPDPRQALAAANIDQLYQDNAPSIDDINQFAVSNPSVSDIIASNNQAHNKQPFLKWTALSLFACALLFGQWLYFNFERNAQHPRWQPVYAKICQTLNCELPQYQNINSIKTERLAIKTHPEFANVLIIDMIINNTAQQSQPLPQLNMTFFNLNGEPLAQRLFKPSEYLAQHLQQTLLMPSKTPIHLSFAILDPGNAAVNYSVTLAPAS